MVLKTRPIDLKIGKRGLTPEFLRECTKVLGRDSMIKISLPAGKEFQQELMKEFAQKTTTSLIAKVGRTASFYQPSD